jgi:cation-transporting ATPase E
MQSGLTSAEVAKRVQEGLVNRSGSSNLADYYAIVSRHLFTLFNFMVAPAAVALFLMHEPQAGIAVSGMALVNTTIGLFQELRAKRHLDQLAILGETRARVVRDGKIVEIPSSDVVLGDTLLLQPGDALVADGTVLESQYLEVDEALLTGEADPVRREAGSQLLSGSICVAGQGCYRADKVGSEAYAQTLSTSARRYHLTSSPMTHIINQIIEFLTITAVVLCALYFVLFFLKHVSADQMVLMIAATITSMVPQGLVLTATVSFTLGAVAMARRGALVQRLNAVEAMASIDVICTDKTGTLTTNRLHLVEMKVLATELAEDEVRRRVSLFATASVDRQNKNIQAILAAFGEQKAELVDQIPFKSQNRFSANRIRHGATERILVMGAPEGLLAKNGQWSITGPTGEEQLEPFQRQGLRVLLVGEVPQQDVANISFASLQPSTPLYLLAIIALGDELRPEAASVIAALSAQGIAFKVLSGDNPETVRATVADARIAASDEPVVSGQDVPTGSDWSEHLEKHSIFGRVAPHQKVEIVESLQKRGRRVAMIGDGVNDVIALKRSDLGIAMGEGTQAAKKVSGLVLENNRFALLPEAIEEGRTIVRNLRRAAKIFLVKNVYSLIMIVTYASGLLGIAFPYRPQQVTLLNWLVIGLPALVIAFMKERSTSATRPHFLREVGFFAIRTGVIFGLAGILMLSLTKHVWEYDERTQRTMLLSLLILLGITALFQALKDGEAQRLQGDSRLRWLAACAVPAYLLAMYWHFSSHFFELTMLSWMQWVQVLVVVLPTIGVVLLSEHIGKQKPPSS